MKLVNFAEIEPLLTTIKGFEEQAIYTKTYSDSDFFVLYEEDAALKSLPLENFVDDKFIEGYIFKQNLHVEEAICSIDTDYSPFLVVLGNVKATQITLAGNDCYIGGNLECSTLWGIYNHGSLIVKGNLAAQLLYSDGFVFSFGAIAAIIIIIGDEKATYKDANDQVLMTKSHELHQIFNESGLKLCEDGSLFQYLISEAENKEPILRTTFDFYENFSESVRPAFDEIFNSSAFEKQEVVELKAKNSEQYGVIYSYTKTENANNIVIINTYNKYTATIVIDKQTNAVALNWAQFSDSNFKKVHLYFDMQEQDLFLQARTVKHWFFEAVKEWKSSTMK